MVKGKSAVEQGGIPEGVQAARKGPRTPGGCRNYMRTELTREFPAILKGFVDQAKTGSCAHMKLAAELLEADKTPKPVRSPAMQALLKRMRQGH